MAPDHAQVGEPGQHAVAGRQDRFLGRCPGPAEHVPLGTELLDDRADVVGRDLLAQKPIGIRTRVRKEDVVDESNRRRRAFDVEENRADAALAKAARHARAGGGPGGK